MQALSVLLHGDLTLCRIAEMLNLGTARNLQPSLTREMSRYAYFVRTRSICQVTCLIFLLCERPWRLLNGGCSRLGCNVQARMGQFQSALAAYSRAADLAPGIAGYRLRQAELLFQNDRAHDADVMMRGVVRKSPNYAGE